MPRQVRIEYAGAFYHVMARGNRKGDIVFDDEDRKTFLRTLGEVCKRAGFRIHAYALMSNHYHLLLETPQANLTAGMGWFQNAYTRRINTRHRLWGHLFGGRYKAIVLEPGNAYWAILDYIHLNPVRAGLVAGRDGMESCVWSSLPLYLKEPWERPEFLEAAMGFQVAGCRDDAEGRKEFLMGLERSVDWGNPTQAGLVFSSEQRRPELSVHAALRRGWFFGSQAFRENLMAKLKVKLEEGGRRSANGYHGPEIKDHGHAMAESLATAGCGYFGWRDEDLGALPKGDERKALIASLIHRETTVPLDWISERLRMGVRAGVCRSIKRHRERLKTDAKLAGMEQEIMSIIYADPFHAVLDGPQASGPDLDFFSMLQPVPATAKFSNPDYNIWCGSAVKGDDGKYHMFYSRWPRKLTHEAWVTHSEIAHAVSDSPFGPWTHHDVALPARGANFWDGSCTHNPTVIRSNGKYYLYYMGNYGDGVVQHPLNWTHRNHQRIGVAVADNPNGPWQRFDQPVIDVSADTNAPDALMVANPSVAVRPDGGILMVYKAVAKHGKPPFGGPVSHLVATADTPTGPFTKHPGEVFGAKGVMFAAEDPFIWRGDDRYWSVVKDFQGNFTHRGLSLALFESTDGFDWKLAKHPLVNTTQVTWPDGSTQKLAALERPQLVFDHGQPIAMLCAAADNPERVGSFNVGIPLKSPKQSKASD